MAEIVVKRSALGAFLDELPGLILQYNQMQYAQEERALEREERKAAVTQQILLKEYYDKKAEVKTTEAMFNKYDNLGPADVSQGGADIINIVDEQNNINMQAVTQNLNTLSNYQSELQTGLSNLKGQAQTLKEMQADFAGANRVLEPHEYQAFQEHALQALDEGGLGWSTTAGADVEYFKKDPTTRQLQAYQMTERMKSDYEKTGGGDYTIFQQVITLGEGEDLEDLADRLEVKDVDGKTIHRPSEQSLMLLQNMSLQTNFEDFVAGIETYPSDRGGDQLRADIGSNLNLARLYNNISGNAKAIQTLDTELAGINDPIETTNLDHFVSNISGITDKQALFGLYDQFTSGLDPSQHESFFNAMEAQLGMGDLGPAYMEFKGFAGGGAEITGLPEIEIDSALRSLEQGFAPPENIFRDQVKIPADRDYYLDDSFERFLEQTEE